MNIFVLSEDHTEAAISQCDVHVRKMIVESAQMLSTAHRVIDGVMSKQPSKSGKTNIKVWSLKDERDEILYKAVHYNHPCTIWARKTSGNYEWLYNHFVSLSKEYEFRFNKVHETYRKLNDFLKNLPTNIEKGQQTSFVMALDTYPECIIPGDVVGSYRKYYINKQKQFSMKWTTRERPEWFYDYPSIS